MNREPGQVHDANRDHRVSDAARFLHDRRREALAMIRLWEKSAKPWADDELTYWRGVLIEIDHQAAALDGSVWLEETK